MKTLSIIFQGPITDGISELCHNIIRTQQNFPEAEMIVSTWRISSQEDKKLSDQLTAIGVRLVLNDDPGPIIGCDASGIKHTNLNRLLRSASAGLAATNRPLAIKLRTDTWLSRQTVLPLLRSLARQEEQFIRNPEYRVFHHRVITATWFARDARGSLPFLFHPGDIMLAGLTNDLRLFFSAPPAGTDIFRPASMPGLWSSWRYVPEQWFWIHAISQATGKKIFEGNFNNTPELIAQSEQFFLANFEPFSPRYLGLHWPKYWRCYPLRGLFSLYTHDRWERLARRYNSDPSLPPAGVIDRILTRIWLCGYNLRSRLLHFSRLRALAYFLFNHHR